ncbi:proline-rich transmembrane protein 3 [Polymixia lowei]
MTNFGLINQDHSGSGGPCVLGLGPCIVLTNSNGTNLLWDDMRRTLAFAWELHVFGSASLFALLASMAVLGMAGASTLLHPLCDALTLANGLLLLTGALRAVLLLLDPYGTLQILSRPALAALHNVPLQLLLWAQAALALVALRDVKLVLLPLKLQHPWVVGGLAVSHCTPLLVADLLSSTLSPALPLLLQTLSLCWGLPFCMGILAQSLSHLHSFFRTPIPEWGAVQRTENCARRVIAVCALLGVLCCSLQIYSLLWLYGLLGNWRRFGWGWWLSQFWARVLELAWGFSLLVLGSWIFWTPRRSHLKGGHGQGRPEESKGQQETSFWGRVLANIRKGPLKKSDRNWEDLMPNNWMRHKLSRTGTSNNAISTNNDQASTIIPDHMPSSATSSSCGSQAALLWKRVGERECILSLIEFDTRPPSPINLRRNIDDALHHGHLAVGSIFTPPPPPWTHTVGADVTHGDIALKTVSPAHVGYRWALDTDSTPASPDHFQAKESKQLPNPMTGQIPDKSPNTKHQGEGENTVIKSESPSMQQEDWSYEDITDL